MSAATTTISPPTDTLGAFVDHGRIVREGRAGGPLSGLTFGLKDLFDVKGVPTAAGCPDWLRTHPVPDADSAILTALLDAGATLVGKTHTDEMAWSLNGENAHYGTPRNPAAPGRVPGGSSNGSASAVAGGLVDFAIGSDTGGSIRLPASNCGLYGLRPTHGRLDISGAVALAHSLDTIGWFTRDAELYARIGAVLLGAIPARLPRRLLVATDLFARAGEAVTEAHQPALTALKGLFGSVGEVVIGGDRLPEWRAAFRTIQAAEAWEANGAWVRSTNPAFGPGIRERYEGASKITSEQVDAANKVRADVSARMDGLLDEETVLVLPTTPDIALPLGLAQEELEGFREAAIDLLCTAGLAKLPQFSMPLSLMQGCPLGLSIMGARGMDEALIGIGRDSALQRRTAAGLP